MGFRCALLVVIAAGCAFPDYAFAPETPRETAIEEADSAPDGSIADTATDGIFPLDDTTTETSADTAVVDTAKPDTKPDTMMSDTGSKTGCAASTAMFCRDWDASGGTPTTGWEDSYLTGGGGLFLDGAFTVSSPKSLLSALPSSAGGADLSASLQASFTAPTPTTPMVLDFWGRFDGIPSGSGPLIAKLSRGPGGRGLALYAGDGHLAIDAMGPASTQNYPMTRAMPINVWSHIRLEATLSATASGAFKLFVDDMITPAVAKSGIPTTSGIGVDVKLNVGLYADQADSARKAWFDDVTFGWM